MSLAIFDLDNTLLRGDSDHAWGDFLVEHKLIDNSNYKAKNDQFYKDYLNGVLNIQDYLEFSLEPLTQFSLQKLQTLHQQFMREKIEPLILPKAEQLLAEHKQRGDYLLIITATNQFVTRPIARRLCVDDILSTIAEFDGEHYTGKIINPPCFQEGKITHLEQWLTQHAFALEDATFYSDSHNDLPLLKRVGHPVAVNPDDTLLAYAQQHAWEVLDLC